MPAYLVWRFPSFSAEVVGNSPGKNSVKVSLETNSWTAQISWFPCTSRCCWHPLWSLFLAWNLMMNGTEDVEQPVCYSEAGRRRGIRWTYGQGENQEEERNKQVITGFSGFWLGPNHVQLRNLCFIAFVSFLGVNYPGSWKHLRHRFFLLRWFRYLVAEPRVGISIPSWFLLGEEPAGAALGNQHNPRATSEEGNGNVRNSEYSLPGKSWKGWP